MWYLQRTNKQTDCIIYVFLLSAYLDIFALYLNILLRYLSISCHLSNAHSTDSYFSHWIFGSYFPLFSCHSIKLYGKPICRYCKMENSPKNVTMLDQSNFLFSQCAVYSIFRSIYRNEKLTSNFLDYNNNRKKNQEKQK